MFLRIASSVSLAALLFVSSADIALAASRYWVGGGEAAVRNQWENTANWAATSGGAGGETIPVAADLVIFDKLSGGVNAQIRSNITITGLELNSAWTGSLLQGTGSIAIGTSGMTVGSGRFIGGNAAVANSGSYTQTGGVVTGLMNTFSLSGSLSITKGAGSVYSTFTNTGTLIFNGNADQNFTVGANVTKTFKNLTLNNVGGGTSDDIVTNVNGELFLSGALTITSGNLDLSTNDMALVTDRGITLADSANASLTTDSNVTASGTILVNDAATLTVTAGTWTLNDDSDQAVDLDGQALFNLTLNNVGGGTSDDVTIAGGPLLLSGALTVTLGNLDMTSNSLALITERGITLADAAQATFTTNSNVTASGTILVNDAATLTVTAGTWTLNDDSDQTVDFDGQSLYNLTINNTGGGTSDDVVVAADSQILLSGALIVTLGNLDLTTNTETLVVDRGITLADAAQATLTTNSNIFASGTILVNDAATLTVTAGTLTLNDIGDQAVDLDGQAVFNLTVNNAGGGTDDDIVFAGGPLLVSGALVVTLGGLDMTTNSLTLITERGITLADAAQATFTTNSNVTASGTILVNDAATLTVTAGTWTLNDDSDQAVDLDGQSLYNLTVNNTGGGTSDDVTIAGGTLSALNDLTVTLGNLDLTTNSLALDVDNDVSIAAAAQAALTVGAMNVGGDFTLNTGGVFTQSSGTATFDGTSQTLSGAITFDTLVKDPSSDDTIYFSDAGLITVSNEITMFGGASSTLSIRSTTSGTRWRLNAPANQNVAGVDVKDSAVVNAENSMNCKARCVDSGNNLNWVLFATATTTTASDGSTGGVSGSGGGGRRSGGGGGGGGTTATTKAKTPVPAKNPPATSYRAQGGPTSALAEALIRLRDRLEVRINKRIAVNPSVAPFLNRLLERLDARIAARIKKG